MNIYQKIGWICLSSGIAIAFVSLILAIVFQKHRPTEWPMAIAAILVVADLILHPIGFLIEFKADK